MREGQRVECRGPQWAAPGAVRTARSSSTTTIVVRVSVKSHGNRAVSRTPQPTRRTGRSPVRPGSARRIRGGGHERPNIISLRYCNRERSAPRRESMLATPGVVPEGIVPDTTIGNSPRAEERNGALLGTHTEWQCLHSTGMRCNRVNRGTPL
jgi:hypothetical protein